MRSKTQFLRSWNDRRFETIRPSEINWAGRRRIAPLIAEGFGQLTDRHVAVYLGRARGSALETTSHLRTARSRQLITDEEHAELTRRYTIIGKRLSRWLHYLRETDWTDRG